MSNKEELKECRDRLDELFNINLNGDWKRYKNSLEVIKDELSHLTDEEVKLMRSDIINKINGL